MGCICTKPRSIVSAFPKNVSPDNQFQLDLDSTTQKDMCPDMSPEASDAEKNKVVQLCGI